MNFTELNLVSPLQKALEKIDFKTATRIQEKVIPLALEWKDILGSAQTGSWKTLAFWLSLLNNLYTKRLERWFVEWKIDRKIQALILAPTRELADQIWEVLKPFCTNVNFKHTVIFWWKNQFHQEKAIKKWVEILVATPGRLIDLLEQKIFTLDDIEYFILFEIIILKIQKNTLKIIEKEGIIERKDNFIKHFFNRIVLINFDFNNIRVLYFIIIYINNFL